MYTGLVMVLKVMYATMHVWWWS